jgi:hypothetical protein
VLDIGPSQIRDGSSDQASLDHSTLRWGGTTAHGFRSSFRDWSAERTDIPRDVCEAALAHTLDSRRNGHR